MNRSRGTPPPLRLPIFFSTCWLRSWRWRWSGWASRAGRVTVRRDSIRKDVWLLRGSPVFARSNDPEDRLIELLGRRSLIPAEKLETARTLVGRDDRRAGEVLVEAGFLKGEELSSMLSEHLVAMVWSVVGWVDGTIEVVEDDRVDEPTSIDTPMAPLLIEGLTHYTEREELER